MRKVTKFPIGSFLVILASYTVFGWLLSIHHSNNWQLWIAAGAIAIGINWLLSLGWAIAVVIFIFSTRPQALALSVGITLIWALVLFIARNEVRAITGNRIKAFFVLAILAAIGMSVGWFTDTSLIPSFGAAIMKVKS